MNREEGADELLTNCQQLKLKSPKDEESGNVAAIARKALEQETGTSVITAKNANQLNHVVTKMIEESKRVSDSDNKRENN